MAARSSRSGAGEPSRTGRDASADIDSEPTAQRKGKRSAPEPATDEATCESVLEALAGGREPRAMRQGSSITLQRADSASLDGVHVGDSTNEHAFIFTSREQPSLFLPKRVTLEGKNPLLIKWAFLKLLPPSWYTIVYELRTSSARLLVDSALYLRRS